MYIYADEITKRIWGATNTTGGAWGTTVLTNSALTITTFGQDQSGELYVSHYSGTTAGALYKIVWKDTDGDGMPDDQELLAGTDPLNPASLLRITATGPTGADWLVTFNTTLNKLYRLERTDDLSSNNWVTITNNVLGTGNPLQVFDPGAVAQPKHFYRVRLLP